jgi:hypothetical protein
VTYKLGFGIGPEGCVQSAKAGLATQKGQKKAKGRKNLGFPLCPISQGYGQCDAAITMSKVAFPFFFETGALKLS